MILSERYPTTKIKYDIPKKADYDNIQLVSLVIYDILGKEISILVNENQKPGYYEVEWNATNLSSGIYFIKLRADNGLKFRKMVLLK